MSKPKLTNREKARIKAFQDAPAPVEKPISLRQAFRMLFHNIWFNVKPPQYLNKSCLYMGKYRKITGENSTHFFLADFPKIAFPKKDNKFNIK